MAYYTAAYSKTKRHLHEQRFDAVDGFIITKWQGRLFLYKDDYRIAELTGGEESLNKRYKGSTRNWINSIREKDEDKISNLNEYIKQIKEDIKIIKSIWND